MARVRAAAAKAEALQERARKALADAESAAAAAAADHAAVLGRLRAAEEALEAATARRDPSAGAAVEAARQRLADAEAAVEDARAGGDVSAGVEHSIDEVNAERLRLEAELLALETPDPLPVRLALADMSSDRRGTLVPSPEAIELAERWAILEVDIARLGADVDDEVDNVDRRAAARRRLVEAETELTRLEAAVRGPLLDPHDVSELERIHEEVLEAREATEKRFGGAKAQQRLDELVAAEQEVLARLGFVTWADFRLGAPSASVASEEELSARLAVAEREFRAAQAEHDALEASIDAELAKAEVLDRRRRLRSMAVEVLGFDPQGDVEGALRRHRITVEDAGAHLERLRTALSAAGVAVEGEDLDERALTDLASVWLQEQDAAEQRRAALQAELAEVEVTLGRLTDVERVASADPVGAASAGVHEAAAALAAAEERFRASEAATASVDALRADLEALNAEESIAATRRAHADEQVLAAAAMLRAADEEARRHEDSVHELEQVDETAAVVAAEQAERRANLEAAAGDHEALAAALEEAHDAVEDAREAYAERGRQVGEAMAELDALRREAEAAAAAAASAGEHGSAGDERAGDGEGADGGGPEEGRGAGDDLEWYLLARLAAQRSVSYAGSVPLVLDDTLAGLDPNAARSILQRLERMSSTVQIIIVTEDLASARWAEDLGAERAMVVQR
jgi:hypothetical protein